MLKRLKKTGNSHALTIDKSMMQQLGITPDTLLSLVISNGQLIVSPTNVGVGSELLRSTMEDIFDAHDAAFIELAK